MLHGNLILSGLSRLQGHIKNGDAEQERPRRSRRDMEKSGLELAQEVHYARIIAPSFPSPTSSNLRIAGG